MGRPRLYLTEADRKRANVVKAQLYRKRHYAGTGFTHVAENQNREPVPDHVLADAQFRNAIPDHIFGDPKPGQSALDKREAQRNTT